MTFGLEHASYLIALPPPLPFCPFFAFVLDLQLDCRCYWEARYRCGPVRCTACGTSARKDERSVWGCAAYGYLLLRHSYPPDASRGNDLRYTFFTLRFSLLFVFTAWLELWLYWLNPRAGVLIGLPSGQDGPILPARDFPRWSRKAARKNYLFCHIVINPLLTNLFRLHLGQ